MGTWRQVSTSWRGWSSFRQGCRTRGRGAATKDWRVAYTRWYNSPCERCCRRDLRGLHGHWMWQASPQSKPCPFFQQLDVHHATTEGRENRKRKQNDLFICSGRNKSVKSSESKCIWAETWKQTSHQRIKIPCQYVSHTISSPSTPSNDLSQRSPLAWMRGHASISVAIFSRNLFRTSSSVRCSIPYRTVTCGQGIVRTPSSVAAARRMRSRSESCCSSSSQMEYPTKEKSSGSRFGGSVGAVIETEGTVSLPLVEASETSWSCGRDGQMFAELMTRGTPLANLGLLFRSPSTLMSSELDFACIVDSFTATSCSKRKGGERQPTGACCCTARPLEFCGHSEKEGLRRRFSVQCLSYVKELALLHEMIMRKRKSPCGRNRHSYAVPTAVMQLVSRCIIRWKQVAVSAVTCLHRRPTRRKGVE